MIEVAETKELLDLLLRRKDWPFRDRHRLLWVHTNLSMADDHTEEGDFGFEELALGDLERELVMGESAKNFTDVFPVLVLGIRKDEDVIYVYDDLAIVDEVVEDVVHHLLERGGGVAYTEEHDEGWHPLEYFSKALNSTERNYEIYDKELMAMIVALESWQQYLLAGLPMSTETRGYLRKYPSGTLSGTCIRG